MATTAETIASAVRKHHFRRAMRSCQSRKNYTHVFVTCRLEPEEGEDVVLFDNLDVMYSGDLLQLFELLQGVQEEHDRFAKQSA